MSSLLRLTSVDRYTSTPVQGASPPLPPPLAPGAASTSHPAASSNHRCTLTEYAPSGDGNNGDLVSLSQCAQTRDQGSTGSMDGPSVSIPGLPVSPRPNSRSSSSSGRQEPAPLTLPQQTLNGGVGGNSNFTPDRPPSLSPPSDRFGTGLTPPVFFQVLTVPPRSIR